MNEELSEKIILVLEASVMWGILYLVTHFAVIFFSIKKSLIQQLEENIKKLNQNLDTLQKYFSPENNIEDNISIITKSLSLFLKKQKDTLKLAKIYLFDNPDFIDGQLFYDEMILCRKYCQTTMFLFNKNEYEKIPPLLNAIKTSISSCDIPLSNLRKEEEKKKIKKF